MLKSSLVIHNSAAQSELMFGLSFLLVKNARDNVSVATLHTEPYQSHQHELHALHCGRGAQTCGQQLIHTGSRTPPLKDTQSADAGVADVGV
jgi:hypothetical protein